MSARSFAMDNGFRERVLRLRVSGADVLAKYDVVVYRAGRTNGLIHCLNHGHPDRNPSCSVNLSNGKFFCHGCKCHGDIVNLNMILGNFNTNGESLEDLEQFSGQTSPYFAPRPSFRRVAKHKRTIDGETIVVDEWKYKDALARHVFTVERIQFRLKNGSWSIDPKSGKPLKSYRTRLANGAWGLPEQYKAEKLRPLYALPSLLSSPIDAKVFVVEGEPAADALRRSGYLATTSSGGSSNPHKSDWSPLAGRSVVIWPDNDDAGLNYLQSVTTCLLNLSPSPSISRVAIEDMNLPEHGDAVDWLRIQESSNNG